MPLIKANIQTDGNVQKTAADNLLICPRSIWLQSHQLVTWIFLDAIGQRVEAINVLILNSINSSFLVASALYSESPFQWSFHCLFLLFSHSCIFCPCYQISAWDAVVCLIQLFLTPVWIPAPRLAFNVSHQVGLNRVPYRTHNIPAVPKCSVSWW